MREDVSMDEYIYGNSVPHFQGKTVRHKIQQVELTIIPNVPKVILNKYNKVTLFCDLMYINVIGLLNTISRHNMLAI